MVAIAYTDITAPAPRAVRTAKVQQHRPVGDPLIDATTRLLSVPLRQMYAVLWRTGLLELDA